MTESDTITRNAKSNLAFALVNLPEETRRHMAQLYAFCRIVDDIVDEPGMNEEERHAALTRWASVVTAEATPAPGLETEVRALIDEASLDTAPMLKLIEGCRRDITPQHPRTIRDMLDYCYAVASCVGITSAAVMGASSAARSYAVVLGYALQMVNILRDVAEDCRRYGRFYIPAEDMALFGVTCDDIRNERFSYRMRRLLAYEAALAEKFFEEADELYAALPAADRTALIPAQAMKLIYHSILEKMEADEYRIFEQRYSVNAFRKLWSLLRARLGTVDLPGLPNITEWGIFRDEDGEDA